MTSFVKYVGWLTNEIVLIYSDWYAFYLSVFVDCHKPVRNVLGLKHVSVKMPAQDSDVYEY